MTGIILNATTSINYWIDQNCPVPATTAAGTKVCFFYEGNQKLTYPGVVVHHYNVGGHDHASHDYYNQFSIDVQVNRNQDIQAWAIMDAIYTAFGYTSRNVLQMKQVPLLNWTNKLSPAATGNCIRIILPDGQAWTQRDDMDKDIRHYSLDLEALYS